jgi:hypothetical protein
MKKSLLSVLVAGLFSLPALAFEPFAVKDIRVEGIQRTEAGTVFGYLPVKVGETLTDEKAAASIKALFATGFFKDVRIEVDGNVMVIVVQERPAIAQIDFVGLKEFEKDVIVKALKEVGIADGRIFDRALLDKAEQELKRQYLTRGKYGVEITTTVTPLERNRVGHQFQYRRRLLRQDPPDQHRRRQGFFGKRPGQPVPADNAGLDHLVHQERPVLEAEAFCRHREAQVLLHEPRLPRVCGRVHPGFDLP